MEQCCSVCQAGEPERVELLSSKVILKNGDSYFVLSDGSFWKAVTFAKRWRTASEWWNDTEIVPSEYECVPNNWHLGGEIWVYPKYGNLAIDEKSASNYEAIHECTHLLVNDQTGQIIFAVALHPADCLIHIYNDAQKESYDEGYTKGRRASTQNATNVLWMRRLSYR